MPTEEEQARHHAALVVKEAKVRQTTVFQAYDVAIQELAEAALLTFQAVVASDTALELAATRLHAATNDYVALRKQAIQAAQAVDAALEVYTALGAGESEDKKATKKEDRKP